jgi:hypothetical protein
MGYALGRRGLRLLGVTALLLALAGGIAYATIPSSNKVFTACMLNNVGTIRLIDPSLPSSNLMGHCTSVETQISFNQQGQQGPQGPAGAPGAPGQNGVGVTSALLPVGDVSCPYGGARFTSVNGVSYACSGTPGAPGTPGNPGANGAPGQNGISVKSADVVIVGAGQAASASFDAATGNIHFQIPQGPPGPPGQDGSNGTNGTNGTNGVDGQPGQQGLPGPAGPQGPAGSPGSGGLASFDGLNGLSCSNGGSAGTIAVSYAMDGTVSLKCNSSTAPGGCTPPAPTVANATVACVNGSYVIASCNPGFADTNGVFSDGCEATVTPPNNCIPPLPVFPNATVACVNGSYVMGSCNPGFADANSNPADGCEVNLMTDPKNCGTVGNDVSNLPHAVGACVNGTAQIASCLPGHFDMDTVVSDGCEVQDDGAGGSLGAATGIGSLGSGSSASRTGLRDPLADDWYRVTCPTGCTVTSTLPIDVWNSGITQVASSVSTYPVPAGDTVYLDVPKGALARYTLTIQA